VPFSFYIYELMAFIGIYKPLKCYIKLAFML
jgi:hypothetical protein